MVDRTGEQLGNYRLTQRLGRGGFAEVYLGKHIHLGTSAAIKILHGQLDQKDLETFLGEAKRIAHLRHAHIVRTLDFGIDAFNTPYLVMEYASYGTLRQSYPEGERVPLATIISYVKQIAAALQYTHDHKLVHRDVKPQNILVGNNHQVLLADFGIAVLAHSTSSMTPQNISGTVQYMAPEHIQGQARPASDQYSLGIMVYEWLSGTRPFHGSHYIDIAMQQLQTIPPPLHTKLPTISSEIEQVVMRTLEKEPEKRFPSVVEFAQALDQIYQAQQHTVSPSVIKTPQRTPFSTYQIPQGTTHAFSWTPDGPYVAFGDEKGRIEIWDVAKSKRISINSDHTTAVKALSWSPHGTSLASFAPDEKIVQIWDVDAGTVIARYTNVADPIAWSNDGTRIAVCSFDNTDNTIVQVRYIHSANHLLTITSHKYVHALAWSPRDTYIASLGFNEGGGSWRVSYSGESKSIWTIQVWDIKNSTSISTCTLSYPGFLMGAGDSLTWSLFRRSNDPRIKDSIKKIMWSPDGAYLASHIQYHFFGRRNLDAETNDSPKKVQIWEVATGDNFFGGGSDVQAVTWSPDSAHIAFAHYNGTVELRDVTTRHTRNAARTYKGHLDNASVEKETKVFSDTSFEGFNTDAGVTAVAWSPDSSRIASASALGIMEIWDTTTEHHILTCKGHSSKVTEIMWSPDKTRIACINQDNLVQVWQVV